MQGGLTMKEQVNTLLKEKDLFVNLGCGPDHPEGWINVDYSNRARLAGNFNIIDRLLTKLGIIQPTEFSKETTLIDVRKPLPFGTSTISGFYSSELFEHLLPVQVENLMKECLRVLVAGASMRVHVPDNYEFWKNYCDEHQEMLKTSPCSWSDEYSHKYMSMFFGDICVKRPILGSMGHYHKWAYDEVSLVLLFKRTGFVEVKRKKLHDSDIPNIESVEKKNYLIVEGKKPNNA